MYRRNQRHDQTLSQSAVTVDEEAAKNGFATGAQPCRRCSKNPQKMPESKNNNSDLPCKVFLQRPQGGPGQGGM